MLGNEVPPIVIPVQEYKPFKVFKTKVEAEKQQILEGGFISTDGLKWFLLYIPKDKK